jgi:anti-sigma regulatory factor (Ser/Thr protein kinase)/putative methionine-R-sulfoxide reductase with GAF domain
MEGATVAASDEAEDRLRHIQSLTDRDLANLGTDALLHELLDRAREILAADTAAVLLLDDSGSELVATVARGLEEEVRQNVRIPMGDGFAGRIAAERRPVILERVDHSTVLNPLLRAKGIRSLLGVPLRIDGEVIGVLHVGTLADRRFDDADADLLQLVGDRIALALGARRTTTERTASVALQNSLVPVQLPHVPGLELAGRYVPAENGGVGGDWYDVFTLPTGQVYFSVGDVAGRGLHAAVVMGRLRSTIRAYALEHDDPAAVIARVDRKLLHFEPSEMATMLLVVVDPELRTMQVSLAGHPPPIVAEPGAPARSLDVPPDPPLGVHPGMLRRSTAVALPPGAAVCFFTDGLVERRDVPLDDRLDTLRSVVTADRPDVVCSRAMSALVGVDPPGDDVAILVARRLTDGQFTDLHMLVPARASELSRIRAGVRRWLSAVGASAADVTDLLVAVGEACANAVEHAYGARAGIVDLTMVLEPGDPRTVVVTVRDRGTWRAARGQNRGRGLQLIESICDEHHTETGPEGTEVVMRRHIATERTDPAGEVRGG